jgi:hypothetical protein
MRSRLEAFEAFEASEIRGFRGVRGSGGVGGGEVTPRTDTLHYSFRFVAPF